MDVKARASMSSKTITDAIESDGTQQEDFHYLVACLFFTFGFVGTCLHGRNLSRMWKLNLILPPGLVSVHFHLALGNLGIVAVFPFGGLSALCNRWLFGDLGCQVYGFEGMVCGLSAIFLACVLPLVQYAEIQFGWRTNPKVCHILAFAAWATAVAWSIVPLLDYQGSELDPSRTSCALIMRAVGQLSMDYLVALTLFYFVVPMGLAALSCWLIALDLSSSGTNGKLSHLSTKQLEKLRQTNKLNTRILLTSFLTWLPLGIFATFTIWYGPPNVSPLLYHAPQIAAKFGCALTPLAYSEVLRELEKHKVAQTEKTD